MDEEDIIQRIVKDRWEKGLLWRIECVTSFEDEEEYKGRGNTVRLCTEMLGFLS